jgi:hypothetical protein
VLLLFVRNERSTTRLFGTRHFPNADGKVDAKAVRKADGS